MMRAPQSAGCAGLGWGTWGEADPRGGRAPPPSPLAPVTAVGGLRSAGAGLRRVPAVAPVAAASAVAGDVARRAAMEAMESGEGELLYLDGMVAQHGVVLRNDGGDECRVASDPHRARHHP